MRITGGEYRSRILSAPRGDATRPTSDRVREALFSILSARVDFTGARALDLYAGTGALGLEALSRDGAHVTFVERRREALSALRANIEALGVQSRVSVVAKSVESCEPSLVKPFALVFADPPYADVQSGEAIAAIERVLQGGALAADGLLVLEHSSKMPAPTLKPLSCEESRVYGDTAVSFYR